MLDRLNGEEELIDLIENLESASSPPWKSILELAKERREAESDARFAAICAGEARHPQPVKHEIYNLGQKEFSDLIKNTNDDLSFQVAKLRFDIAAWFDHWEYPPPHFPLRVASILRKSKRLELERRFLAAYLKHFYTPMAGAGDVKIYDRAEKIGILSISSEDRLLMLHGRHPLLQMQLEYEGETPYAIANCRMCGSLSVKMPTTDGPVICGDCDTYLGTKKQIAQLAELFISFHAE